MTAETPLLAKLRRLIEMNGPLSVADYMAHCLGDPAHGYYATRDPFGAKGDFVTAPEISQMFGEILGAWLAETWRLCGAPSPVRLVELGPGRGTLMADILRVASRVPEFHAALSVHLVETSPVLREQQRRTLAEHSAAWHRNFAEIPAGPVLLVANEFFDALPIRQFIRIGGEWRERVVGLGQDGNLVFGVGPGRLDGAPHAAEGEVFEIRPAGEALIADIAARIAAEGGAALVIDYGHAKSAAGDTLQALRRHAFADPLDSPGEADLTAHVDFAALARAARTDNVRVHGPITQGEFLLSLGLAARAERLGATADAATKSALREAVGRLTSAEQMGSLFKVMAMTRDGVVPPPFAAGPGS